MEKTIETKICKHCNLSFGITDLEIDFYGKVSPIFNGTKYQIPSPTLCPDCRQQRRLSFRNERNLYKRKCDLTGKDIISIYSPDKGLKVYEQKEWWSDKWNALDYGKDFDFNKNFFEQFGQLMKVVPYMSLSNEGNEASDFNNDTGYCKNTYLCFFSSKIEDSFYVNGSYAVQDSMDIGWSKDVKNSYECFNCGNIYHCFYSNGCDDCSDLLYCENCTNCKNCFGCVGLKNKNFCFFNEQIEEKEYKEKISQYLKEHKINDIKGEVQKLKIKLPVKFGNIGNSSECFGDYIYWSNNCKYCFEIEGINNGKYLTQCARSSDMFFCDNSGGHGGEGGMLLDVLCAHDCFKTLFSSTISISSNILYSDNCYNSSNLFGCTGLRNSSYCILNKQYTKDEYEVLVPKIIEHMIKTKEYGEFFPSSISPFGYNETVAQEYYPIPSPSTPLPEVEGRLSDQKDNNAMGNPLAPFNKGGKDNNDNPNTSPLYQRGCPKGRGFSFKWSYYEPPTPQVSKIIPASKLPDEIKDIPDDILNWAILCEISEKPFRIIKQELEFYKKHNIPIPKKHPDQRHLDRMKLRNPRKLYDRNCDKCNKEIKTTYNPEREEIVYCEDCYNKEMY